MVGRGVERKIKGVLFFKNSLHYIVISWNVADALQFEPRIILYAEQTQNKMCQNSFIQPKEVSFLNYAIFFDKGSFVFDFIKGVLFFKILNSSKSAFFPGRILFQTSPDKWPGGGAGKDKRVKKEALHDKGSFIF